MMFEFIEKMFIGLEFACTAGSFDESLASNSEGHMKCVVRYRFCTVLFCIYICLILFLLSNF